MDSDLGKLFVGGISWDTNEDRLREYFSGLGEVVEAVIMKDRTTGRARGFGFVVFADPAVAERVASKKHVIDSRMVEAKKAVPRDDQSIIKRSNSSFHGSPGPGRTKKIFVGGLASTVTETDFKKYFDHFGTITDVVVMYDHTTQRPRGFGFVTYDSEDAVDKVLVKTFHDVNGKMVEVKRAVPKELSTGPSVRSPATGYNYGFNGVSNFLSNYNQGYNPSSISGYGMRTDGSFPSFGPGYGVRLNFEPGMTPSYGGNSNFTNSPGYVRALGPYFSGNSNSYPSAIGYGGGNGNTASAFSSVTRNIWGSDGLNSATSSVSSNAFMGSGSGSLGRFGGNNSLNWVGSPSPSPISTHGVGTGSSYASGSQGYGYGESRFGLSASSFGGNSGTASVNPSISASGNGFRGSIADTCNNNSIYGDTTWRSQSSELDGLGPLGYGLGNATTDVNAKGSPGYIAGYKVSNRQTSRGIAA